MVRNRDVAGVGVGAAAVVSQTPAGKQALSAVSGSDSSSGGGTSGGSTDASSGDATNQLSDPGFVEGIISWATANPELLAVIAIVFLIIGFLVAKEVTNRQ